MARVRFVASAALVLLLVFGLTARAPSEAPPLDGTGAAASVGWPVSSGLVVAEVVTGGASASDEYVELYNASAVPVDLAGLEVAYVTSTGSTVTRKTAWTGSLAVAAGQHVLLANALGVYAATADATWSGGLAATGGAVVLRPIGGVPIDAVGWGDATNAFVEGSAAPAPAAGRSIERLPGGLAGNAVDTNDNAADLVANAAPVAQGLVAGPAPTAPVPTATPGVTPSPSPTAEPTLPPTLSPAPTDAPTPTTDPTPSFDPTASASSTPSPTPAVTPEPSPTAAPTASPTPAPTAEPSPAPTAEPSPTPAPTASPTAVPTPSPTPTANVTPTPAPTAEPSPTPLTTPAPTESADPRVSILEARTLPVGTIVTIEGVLTTALGAVDAGLTGFLQDATAGIAVHLDLALDPAPAAGTVIRVTGTLDERYALRIVRIRGADVVIAGAALPPDAVLTPSGAAAELLEGRRIQLEGTVVDAPAALADGLGITLDDGSGPIRVIAGPGALGTAKPGAGDRIIAMGPLGQRDSSGTGVAGYRLHATMIGELQVLPPPMPSPTLLPSPAADPSPIVTPTPTATPGPTPTTTPSPTFSPTPVPTASPQPSPSPSPSARVLAVSEARLAPPGTIVVVRGVVIAESGRLGSPTLLGIADETGGIVLHLADGQAAPVRGVSVEARGTVAAPYGQTEVRLTAGGLSMLGAGSMPVVPVIDTGAVGEAIEGRLVSTAGTVATSATKSASGDLSFAITGTDGATLRIMADRSSGLDAAVFRKGVVATFTGIVGQRASSKGAPDGYRLWLRDSADVARTPAATPTPSASPTASPSASPSPSPAVPPLVSIAAARVREGREVMIEGVVTVDTSLLDGSGRRTIVEDATGAIEVYLAAPDTGLHIGCRVRVTGIVGRAWGAPRVRADELLILGEREPTVHTLAVSPGPATEWRLVRVQGTIVDLHRSGDRWQAELQAGSVRIPVIGLAGSGIDAATLAEGRSATITGIVKRPFPTATDRRYAILPRRGADIVLGGVTATASSGNRPNGKPSAGGSAVVPGGASPWPIGGTSGGTTDVSGQPTGAQVTPDIDLANLASFAGGLVRVGGLVTAVEDGGVRLDDGTATARVVLAAEAGSLLAVLRPGDAINVTGMVEAGDTREARGAETVVVVSDPGAVALLSDLETPVDPSGSTGELGGGGTPGTESPPVGAVVAALTRGTNPGGGPGAAQVSVAILVLAALMAAAAAMAHRRRASRRLGARLAARLDAIAGPGTAPTNSSPSSAV